MSTATSDAGDIDDDVAAGGGAIEVGSAPTFAVNGTGEELRPSTAASRVSFAPDVEVHEGKSGSGVGDIAADEGGKTDASSESTATADVHDESKNGTSGAGAGAGAGAGSGVPDMTDHMIEHLADPKCVCRLFTAALMLMLMLARLLLLAVCVRVTALARCWRRRPTTCPDPSGRVSLRWCAWIAPPRCRIATTSCCTLATDAVVVMVVVVVV